MVLVFKHHRHHATVRIWRSATDDGRVAPECRVGGHLVPEHDVQSLEEAGAEDGDFIATRAGPAGRDETLDRGRSLEVKTLR